MLRLVRVTSSDVDVLFKLVTINNIPGKTDLLAGLTQLHDYFKTTKDSTIRLVLTLELHKQVSDIVNNSFLPADAHRLGIPMPNYLEMVSRLPYIQHNLANPELIDPNFLGSAGTPDSTYLN